MRPTNPRCIQRLSSSIHPQLPLSSRDSDRLLHLLKTSFRKHLDADHAPASSNTPSAAPARPSSRAQIDHNFATILNYPLLQNPRATTHPAVQRKHAEREAADEERKTHINSLITSFDRHVAEARADERIASTLLKSVWRAVLTEPLLSGETLRRRLKTTQAGGKVLNWLWASDRNAFGGDLIFSTLLVRFLVAEGRQDEVWKWLAVQTQHRRGRRPVLPSVDEHIVKHVAVSIMAAELRFGGDLAAASMPFLAQLRNLMGTESDVRAGADSDQKLWQTSMLLTLNIAKAGQKLPVEIYEEWLHNAHLWSASVSFTAAQLWASHPTRPNPLPALQWMQKEYFQALLRHGKSPKKTNWLLNLCHLTAELLEQQGQGQAAASVRTIIEQARASSKAATPAASAAPAASLAHPGSSRRDLREDESCESRYSAGPWAVS